MSASTLISLLIPGGLVFLASAVLAQTGVITAWLPAAGDIYLYTVLVAGLLLGWRFNRSRLFFAVLVLAIAERSLFAFARGPMAVTAQGKLVIHAVTILLPLNLALLSLLKERGIATAHGLWRLCMILAQPLVVAAACHSQFYALIPVFDTAFFKLPLLRHIPGAPLSQAALAAAAVSLLLALAAFLARRGALESGFLWVMPAVLFALTARKSGYLCSYYLSTAGLVLVVSVIESSHFMAFRDELTGLPARRSLNEYLLQLGSRYVVAMVDIDHFKKFNDTYGHDVGDQVLRMVASRLAKVTGGGKAFRYGGEEFTVLFPGRTIEEAQPHLEQLRIDIESAGFTLRGSNRPPRKPARPGRSGSPRKKVSVTVSIGMAEPGDRQNDPYATIKSADKALYRAKKAGRNRLAA
ncbi:MAG: GGDEF domain-containing protein [Syntrophobacteraceae bacterium]|nr:GGDEF domain-containing protein [Desulfobacteraceae bacterium]